MTILRDTLTTLIAERGKLDTAISLLQKLDAGKVPVSRKPIPQKVLEPFGVESSAPKKRKFSASTRRKMAAAQKARWAKLGKPPIEETPAIKKNRISAAGRKRIAAATKARWAAVKAAGKTNLNAKVGKKGKSAGAGG
jgi:hypothetical protein